MIDGQISIFEYLEHMKPRAVDIRGICDDAYCPECGYCLDERIELDCERCPVCNLRIDWTRWHRINDVEENNEQTLDQNGDS